LRAYHPGPEGTQIGGIGLHPTAEKGRGVLDFQSGSDNEYELGFLLKPNWQGKGIMRAAVKEFVRYGTEVLKVDIIARVAIVNKASRALIERMEGWQRVPKRDGEVDWPANKGGDGKRKLLFWKWIGTSSSTSFIGVRIKLSC
jgi:RimJ/RimL family protein N-acetyltransferase